MSVPSLRATSTVRTQGAANVRWASAILRALFDGGARDFVLSPGSRNTPIVLAAHALSEAHGDVRTHVLVDERSAAFFAVGLARATGRPVVLSCSSGSAGANYHPAFAEADGSGLPLIALTADRPSELLSCRAPQTMTQAGMLATHARASFDLPAPAAQSEAKRPHRAATNTARAALIAARGDVGAPGPVHVNVHFREPLWDATASTSDLAAHTAALAGVARDACTTGRAHADHNALLASLMSPLAGSEGERAFVERGLILVGPTQSAHVARSQDRADLRDAIGRLSKATGWPVLADPASQLRSKGSSEEATTLSGYDTIFRAIHSTRNSAASDANGVAFADAFISAFAAEHVLVIGDWPTSKALGLVLAADAGSVEHPSADAPKTRISSWTFDGRVSDPHGVAGAPLRVDISALGELATLAEAQTSAPTAASGWRDRWHRADSLIRGHLEASTGGSDGTDGTIGELWEAQVLRLVGDSIRPDEHLHVASSMPIRDADTAIAGLPDTSRCFASRGVNGIDGTLATAAGEAAGSAAPVTLVVGDVTFLHDAGSLAWIPPHARLRIVVIDNSGGGIFHHLPIATHDVFERYFVTPPTVDVGSVARGYGWPVTQVRTARELADALARPQTWPTQTSQRGRTGDPASAAERPPGEVIHVLVDRHSNVATHRSFWAQATQILHAEWRT